MTPRFPCALTIAGSDSGGGAGIQGDLKTFFAFGVYGASVITAVTAQNTRGVTGVYAVPPAVVTAQLEAVLADLPICVIKIGMLASADNARAVADVLDKFPALPVVLDPVLAATSGDTLTADDALAVLRTRLIPRAWLLTPNYPEAAALLNRREVTVPYEAANALLRLGPRAVLLKGGHAEGERIIDLLCERGAPTPRAFPHPRIDTPHTHGTGCALSSAIAAELARGFPLADAVERGIAWLQDAIAAAGPLGAGHGPVLHGWQTWKG